MRRAIAGACVAGSFALVLIVGGCGGELQERPAANDWAVYEADDGSFSLSYPANFEAFEIDPDELNMPLPPDEGLSIVIFGDERPDLGTATFAGIMGAGWSGTELRLGAMVLPSGEFPSNVEMFVQMLRDGNESYAGYQELHFEPVTISGLNGFDYAFETTGTLADGQEARQTLRQVLLSDEDRLYLLNVGALSSTYGQERGVVDQFFDSFRASGK